MPWLQLWFHSDTTTIWLRRDSTQAKKLTSIFCRSHIVVVSQLNQMHVVILITFIIVECVMVSSYRGHVVVESQLWYMLMGDEHPPTLQEGHGTLLLLLISESVLLVFVGSFCLIVVIQTLLLSSTKVRHSKRRSPRSTSQNSDSYWVCEWSTVTMAM